MQDGVSADYVTRVDPDLVAVPAADWDALLARQATPTPFMRHAWLRALVEGGSATAANGWGLQVISLWRQGELQAACPLWLKGHSRGEYVFDFAWAQAYERHGLPYYPKGLVASPFTPVPGSRLLACDAVARTQLLRAVLGQCQALGLSGLHLLYGDANDRACAQALGLMERTQVQFHWQHQGWADFEAFLQSLSADRRKKIRQERRKVREAGVTFRAVPGPEMGDREWALLERCYSQTYWEHGNPPYLQPPVFQALRRDMPEAWVLFVAERAGQDIGMSLIGLAHNGQGHPMAAYGRYWGALERVDCLHFEACYYQPLAWCIAHGVQRFEGGAQGEHKIHRALLPTTTHSQHWVAHPGFAEAIERFLVQERAGVAHYQEALAEHSPLRR